MNKPIIYLASKSPRRQHLLQELCIKFQTITPTISEEHNEKNPTVLAIKLAQEKVNSVKERVNQGIFIGVDTVVVIDNRIMGKPKDKKEAYQMMNLLNNREHQVISGLYMLRKPGGRFFKASEKTIVRLRKLSNSEIIKYINTSEPYDKAGGYGIQERAGFFVENIRGCYYNVVGLPIYQLLRGFKILKVII